MKCSRCKEREGILDFSTSTMDWIHGFVEKICRECLIEGIEKELIKIKANLKDQKTLLRKEKFKERRKPSEGSK